MNRFILKLSLSLILLGATYLCSYYLILFVTNKNLDKNTIYIWGDSQVVRGIDLKVLETEIERKVLSNAKHGAGVYDFITFTNLVPDNSDIIISLSKSLQLRKKENDRNISYLSFEALYHLYKNNYSLTEIYEVILKNRKPTKLFSSQSNLYECLDSLTLKESIEFFEDIFNSKIEYLEDKQNICIEGIKNLNEKNCNIHFLDFPFHEKLAIIENQSAHKKRLENFLKKINNDFILENDTLILLNSKESMYDLTHLNKCGAIQVSKYLRRILKNKNSTFTRIILHKNL